MIEDIGIDQLLPGFSGSVDSAVELYQSFGTTRGSFGDLEAAHGAVAIDIVPLTGAVSDWPSAGALEGTLPPPSYVHELSSSDDESDGSAWSRPSTIY